MARLLMILAGLPGAGKTTLLNRARARDLALFGPENQPAFRAVMDRNVRPREVAHFDPRLNLMTFTLFRRFLRDYRKFGRAEAHVLHLDIVKFYRFLGCGDITAPAADFRRAIAGMGQEAGRRRMVCGFVGRHFPRHFDRVIVNTIDCPVSLSIERVRQRRQDAGLPLGPERASHGHAERVRETILDFWRRDLSLIAPDGQFTTREDGDGYVIEARAASGQPAA